MDTNNHTQGYRAIMQVDVAKRWRPENHEELYYQMNAKGRAVLHKTLVIMPIVMFLVTVLMLVEDMFSRYPSPEMYPLFLLMIVPGVFMLRWVRKDTKVLEDYLVYMPLILRDPARSITTLADTVGKDVNEVAGTLELFIRKHMLPFTLIEYSTMTLKLPANPVIQQGGVHLPMPGTKGKPHPQGVTCSQCGAMNRYNDHAKVCEYCGSPLDLR